LTFMNRILSLQFYLVSSSSAGPWPGALPLQLRDPNYSNGDTNTFSKRMFEQFTEYLTGWQICHLPPSSEGWKLFSFRGLCTPDQGPGDPTPATTPPPPLQTPLASRLKLVLTGRRINAFCRRPVLTVSSHGYLIVS